MIPKQFLQRRYEQRLEEYENNPGGHPCPICNGTYTKQQECPHEMQEVLAYAYALRETNDMLFNQQMDQDIRIIGLTRALEALESRYKDCQYAREYYNRTSVDLAEKLRFIREAEHAKQLELDKL